MMDVKLSYSERGAGFPFILLHGNGEKKEYFEYQINYFSKSYRVIAIDTRGHGASKRGTLPFTLEQFANDLKNFLDELGIQKANILGFSDGGNVALLFALKNSKYVNKLILNGANLHPSGVKLSAQLPIYIGYGIVFILSKINKKILSKKELLELMVCQPDIKKEELLDLTIPTLIIVGDNDMIRQAHTKMMANNINSSQLCIIEGNHFIASNNSREFNAKVEQFLLK